MVRPRDYDQWPHYFEKFPENPEKSYVSRKILGQLYDAVDKVSFHPEASLQDAPRRRGVIGRVPDPVAALFGALVAQDRLEQARIDALPTPSLLLKADS